MGNLCPTSSSESLHKGAKEESLNKIQIVWNFWRILILYYLIAYIICAFQFFRLYYLMFYLRVGILIPLPSWANSSFNCSKATFSKGSITSRVAQSGQGLRTVWESISICLFHVPQAHSTIRFFFSRESTTTMFGSS